MAEHVEETPQEKEARIAAQREKDLAAEAEKWDPEKDAHERQQESHKTVICYNSSCADYRIPRTDGSACACKRRSVSGAGV